MKSHVLWMAGLLAGGFIIGTSCNRGRFSLFSRAEEPASVSYSTPTVVKGAGLSPDEQNNVEVYRRANEATVAIVSSVLQPHWFYDLIPVKESGSGFLIDDKGTILTNHHVISGRAPRIEVTLAGGRKYPATPLARDAANDLAILRINVTQPTKFLPLGDSEKLQVGQKVLAIGNPFGVFEGTLTTGVVSSLNRTIAADENTRLEGMIQTDAAINPGNSGGPLLDSNGTVIGVNTAIYGPGGSIGLGFAMPVNKAKVMLDDLRAGRRVGRPILGVDVLLVQGDIAAELGLPEQGGLLIYNVTPGLSAEAAGLRGARREVIVGNYRIPVGGDLIMAVEGQPANHIDSIRRALASKRPGDKLTVTIWRNGRRQDVAVTLMASPDTL